MHDPRVVEAVGAEAARFLRDETVFGVTNYRYRASPAFDRVFFRRRCNDSTFQRITTAKLMFRCDPVLAATRFFFCVSAFN
jgi:hypothetical protein